MSTEQEYWDACLIKAWRNAGTVSDALRMFESITHKPILDSQLNLKRFPSLGYPWEIGIRVFVANHLSKISNRLWNQAPEKDVLLLRKLATSDYDTEKEQMAKDIDLNREYKQHHKNKAANQLETTNYSKRNRSTDWNVHKGSRK